MEPSSEQIQKWHNDPKNWKGYFFYYNKADQRLIVDKPNPRYGLTFNFAHPKSYWFLAVMFCFFGFVLYMISRNVN